MPTLKSLVNCLNNTSLLRKNERRFLSATFLPKHVFFFVSTLTLKYVRGEVHETVAKKDAFNCLAAFPRLEQDKVSYKSQGPFSRENSATIVGIKQSQLSTQGDEKTLPGIVSLHAMNF